VGLGRMRNAYRILVETLEGKRQLGRPRYRWRVVLKLILGKWGLDVWIGFMWLRIGLRVLSYDSLCVIK
jgi:hypothetical protein